MRARPQAKTRDRSDVNGGIERDADSAAHGCQMAKFDPFLSLDCARVEGVGAQSKESKERKG